VSAEKGERGGGGAAEPTSERAEGARRHSVRVSILGDEYVIRTTATAAHTRQVAEHVDRIIRQVLSAGSVVETHKAAILAALQITDELFRARADAERVSQAMQSLSAEVRKWLPPGKREEEA
jgi:cell division protein ZapA